MKTVIDKDLVRVVIIDISGVYAQIHDQGYFLKESINELLNHYIDEERWRVLVL